MDKLTNIPSPNRLAIKLKPAAERMAKKGHPWLFEGGIVKQSQEGKAGDLAIIFDNKKNKFLACGLFDPHSPIRVKLLQFKTSATIDKDWFQAKINQAFALRAPLLATKTNSYRLIYGENDGLPGFVADVYKEVLVVKLYSHIWLPYLKEILPLLLAACSCETIVLRFSRNLQTKGKLYGLADGQVLFGTLENEVIIFEEHGIRFAANVIHGHKTGFFLDHRHNRKRIGKLAKGKTVLDVFSYAGGFSVHALAGGATEVTSLDISAQALEMATQNAALNPHQGQHKTLVADAFASLENMAKRKTTFDLVIIDPPSFAKRESEVEKAKHSYRRLAKLGAKLVNKGGLLVLASCSSRIKADDFFALNEKTLQTTGKHFELLEKTLHDIDHPVGFPEGAYLKCGYYRQTYFL